MIRLVIILVLLGSACPAQDVAALRARQEVVRAALVTAQPSIVRIDTIGGAAPRQEGRPGFKQADGPTTGLIVDTDGWILTSSFNFVRDPQVITVRLHDGRRLVAELVARDRVAKLALLKVPAEALPVLRWRAVGSAEASTPGPLPGQTCFAAGLGHGSSIPTVAVGIISALERMDGIALQTDARVSPASYGGPLLDLDGQVLGICVPLATSGDELAGAEWYDSGIAFAIRPDFILPRLARLKQGENLERGLLGVFLDMGHPVVGVEDEDLPVAGRRLVRPPSGPAKRAGLEEGDILTVVAGKPCPTPVALKRILARHTAGETIDVTFWRDGEERTLELKLASTAELIAEAEAEAAAEAAAAEETEEEGRPESD